MAYEKLLYLIPIFFSIFQTFIYKIIGRKDVKEDIIITLLIIPFATAFFFLQTSVNLVFIFMSVQFIIAFIALTSYAAKKDNLGHLFVFFSVLVIVIEYLQLYLGIF